ncbi:hypothetical protein MYU51_019989 [Penicillium brevicompactum]|uniref:uncharacterized protein n=1 Tax=Penicillium brevicompactum TaxID=5074 RepID=UPI00253F6D30|nr:uncharacterized protein N7506_004084 [Penicillium brevicompactum]KAJ5336062.1 hypothetical protein N7506_004084 [Penicillium brevicompactum]
MSTSPPFDMTFSALTSLSDNVDPWDLDGRPELGAFHQPWRAYWPPDLTKVTDGEMCAKPWLTWKNDPTKMNNKPWYDWVHPELEPAPSDGYCPTDCSSCQGAGCGPYSTGAEGA